jgi:hypothetical protein
VNTDGARTAESLRLLQAHEIRAGKLPLTVGLTG